MTTRDVEEIAKEYLNCAARCGITKEEATALIEQMAGARVWVVNVEEAGRALRKALEKMGGTGSGTEVVEKGEGEK